MSHDQLLVLAADGVLVTHFAFVAFVVLGLPAVLVGAVVESRWIRNLWFRVAHLAAIGFVVLESWLGVPCPLTIWEQALRERAGDASWGGDFVQYWLRAVLFYEAPAWVFTTAYTLFGALVLATWILLPPRRRRAS